MPAHRSDAEAEIREAVVQHLRRARPEARIMHEVNIASGQLWWHPKAQDIAEAQHPALNWRGPEPHAALQVALPQGALAMLHRDELERVCHSAGIGLPRHANMGLMEQALRWGATGRQITLGICEQLRRRTLAAEADDPITEDAS